jgi:hypothetical protein
MSNGGSDCVGANNFRAGIFWNSWTTRINTFRYKLITLIA